MKLPLASCLSHVNQQVTSYWVLNVSKTRELRLAIDSPILSQYDFFCAQQCELLRLGPG